jgi:hypothetical protein
MRASSPFMIPRRGFDFFLPKGQVFLALAMSVHGRRNQCWQRVQCFFFCLP